MEIADILDRLNELEERVRSYEEKESQWQKEKEQWQDKEQQFLKRIAELETQLKSALEKIADLEEALKNKADSKASKKPRAYPLLLCTKIVILVYLPCRTHESLFTDDIMPKPYSVDLRKQILKDYDRGISIKDLAKHYGVSRS